MKYFDRVNILFVAAVLFFSFALSTSLSDASEIEVTAAGECLRCVDGETCTRSLSGGTQCYGDCTHDDNCSTKIEPLPPVRLSQ